MINLSEIASYILEKSNNPNNKSVTYVRGLIWEQLELRSYKKLLNEDINPDDDEIINDESLDSLVQDIDKDSNERDDIDLNLGLKPETGEDLDLEPEEEEIPDAEIEPEEEPIDLDGIDVPPATVSNPNPTEPTTKTLPGSDIEVISSQQAKELLSYKGKIFTAVFTKKNGERRVMNGLTGVRKFTSGGTLRYSPKEKNLIPVYDLKIGMGAKGYRMINMDGLEALKINGKQYKIDHSIRVDESNKTLLELLS